jgi:hypothetical protein
MPLRHSWSERTLLPDSVAAEIQAKMSDCHRQVHFNLQPKRGYGASLNVWMGALCVAMQQNMKETPDYLVVHGLVFTRSGAFSDLHPNIFGRAAKTRGG